jgi:hypothetical protein
MQTEWNKQLLESIARTQRAIQTSNAQSDRIALVRKKIEKLEAKIKKLKAR